MPVLSQTRTRRRLSVGCCEFRAITPYGVIHFLVESGTFYGAVTKGAAAATLLTSGRDEPIDDCTLIYDLDDEPAPQLTERWPTLPAAVEVDLNSWPKRC